jgi:hypothetical protein
VDPLRLGVVGALVCALTGCGAARGTGVGTSAPLSRATPTQGGQRGDCYFRIAYEGGTVLLDFANRTVDCTTLSRRLQTSGPPFGGELWSLDRLTVAAGAHFICVRSKFYADVMAVYTDGEDTRTAVAFCSGVVGQSPPSA